MQATCADERFADNPLVTGPEPVRASAGAPVLDRDELPLGARCVLDREPHDLDATALAVPGELATSVAAVLDRHRPDAPEAGRAAARPASDDPLAG